MQEIQLDEKILSKIDFKANEEKDITITGMIQNLRVLGWGAFLILRTPEYTLQTIIDKNNINIPPDELLVESTVSITGTVKPATIKDKALNPRDYEIHVKSIEIIAASALKELPADTTKKELNVHLDTKFDLRPLTLRHPRERAIFRIASTIAREFGDALGRLGFTQIYSPKLVASGAEGGANIFKMDYFGREAYLAQSPQFYKQMMVGVYGRVFEVAPVFRAEKHDTSRHLNEYISLDLEMGYIKDFYDLIKVESLVLKSIFEKLESNCAHEIELLDIEIPKIDKIVTIKFKEVHEIIFNEFKKDYRAEKDLAPEEEKLICQYSKENWGSELLFVTHYPSEKRPFYTLDDPDDPGYTCSFDLLFRNVEITTGGQRLHVYDDYVKKMTSLGMNVNNFESYLQTFKFGMPPHGGLGLGLERLTSQICGLANVKEASLFPRDINRLEP
ncbi:MAG: aspartate--tRNA(Asn) ligase [Spirochaetales bacterium]|nr:aspartate--tRNA(Asn) ligase [Spirochaetales bacterium]